MTIEAKICGLRDRASLDAAVAHGARLVGFVFYPRSPRALTPLEAAPLARAAGGAARVGLFVDPSDDLLTETLRDCPLDLIQLHGAETPERCADIRTRFGRPVMKALAIADAGDADRADAWVGAVDRLLFDAKPPKTDAALPGGNGLTFDWRLIAGRRFGAPWMLSGGLDAANVAEAIRLTGATSVDVSSGVENAPGVKSAAKIAAFLRAAGGGRD